MANLTGRAGFPACSFGDQAGCPFDETGRMPVLHAGRNALSLAQQNHQQHDQKNNTQAAAGIISPPGAIRPCGQCRKDQKN